MLFVRLYEKEARSRRARAAGNPGLAVASRRGRHPRLLSRKGIQGCQGWRGKSSASMLNCYAQCIKVIKRVAIVWTTEENAKARGLSLKGGADCAALVLLCHDLLSVEFLVRARRHATPEGLQARTKTRRRLRQLADKRSNRNQTTFKQNAHSFL